MARVLLVHGWLGVGAAWAPVQRELGSEVETFAPDLPGYGSKHDWAGACDLRELVEWLAAFAEDHQVTHVAGHSMGAILALALASRAPGHFERIGLTGLPVFRNEADAAASLGLRGRLLERNLPAHAACGLLARTERVWLPMSSLLVPGRPRAAVAGMFEHSVAAHEAALANVVFAGLVEGLAGEVAAPVVALHGARDGLAPIARVRELAKAHRWPLRVSAHGNHQLFMEQPGLTARWIRERVLAERTEDGRPDPSGAAPSG